MASAPRPLVAGNWKMNGLGASTAELEKMISAARHFSGPADLMICPPTTLLALFADKAKGSPLQIGAQDCHAEPSGAFTGDISAEMIADAGAAAVIVGHSERRAIHEESDAVVKAKATAAARAKLTAILCVGETKQEREADATVPRIERQLDGSLPDQFDAQTLVVAYEPVWAIGTGLTPGPRDIEIVHAFIRAYLVKRAKGAGETVRILYGGSVKPSNAKELLSITHVNGALVGGASLKSNDFMGIAAAYR